MSGLHGHSLELTGIAGNPDGFVHRLDPRAKILALAGVTVVAVSAPLSAWPVLLGCAAVPLAIAAAGRVPAGAIWRRARVVLPLILLAAAFVPFLRSGGEAYELGPIAIHEDGLAVFGTVVAKAAIGTLSAVVLGATTTFPAVLRGLEAMRVPRTLILIAAFMYRYLFVLVEEIARLRAALAARGYRPRGPYRAGALGRVATALFLRTYERGERVYLAMLARGYRGEMPRLRALSFGRADAAFVAVVALAVVPLRVLEATGA